MSENMLTINRISDIGVVRPLKACRISDIGVFEALIEDRYQQNI